MDPPSRALVPVFAPSDRDRLKALVLDSVPSPHSRRAYEKSLDDFFDWYADAGAGQGFTKATVQRYSRGLEERGLAASTRNVRLTAVRENAGRFAVCILQSL